MLASIFVTLTVSAGLAIAFKPSRRQEIITRRPYNNPYSDATLARDDRVIAGE